MFAILAEQLLVKEGVHILYGTSVCGVDMGRGRINGLFLENKSGRTAVQVNSVVDASGDADVCAIAGEKTAVYSKKNVLAAWYYQTIDGQNHLEMLGCDESPEGDSSSGLQLTDDRFIGVDGEELSRMTISSHAAVLSSFLKAGNLHGRHALTSIAMIPQIRMSRRIAGVYDLDENEKSFSDSIGMIGNWYRRGLIYEIPYRALYGRSVKNLIVAGRCISSSDAMWDLTRVIPACAVTGEAAGAAAALTQNFQDANVTQLQQILQNRGVRLHRDEVLAPE